MGGFNSIYKKIKKLLGIVWKWQKLSYFSKILKEAFYYKILFKFKNSKKKF